MYQTRYFYTGFLFGITKRKCYLVVPLTILVRNSGRCFYSGFFNVDNFYLEGNEKVTIFDISKTVKQ